MGKKCPFTWLEKDCTPECALYMEVIRILDVTKKEEIVKGCVFVLDHDERRNQTQRLAMMQAEVGEQKQASIFLGAAIASRSPEHRTKAILEMERLAAGTLPQGPIKLPQGG